MKDLNVCDDPREIETKNVSLILMSNRVQNNENHDGNAVWTSDKFTHFFLRFHLRLVFIEKMQITNETYVHCFTTFPNT